LTYLHEATKGTWRMPRQFRPKKDAAGGDTPGEAVNEH